MGAANGSRLRQLLVTIAAGVGEFYGRHVSCRCGEGRRGEGRRGEGRGRRIGSSSSGGGLLLLLLLLREGQGETTPSEGGGRGGVGSQ